MNSPLALRQAGYKVRIFHFRAIKFKKAKQFNEDIKLYRQQIIRDCVNKFPDEYDWSPKGGHTFVFLETPDGRTTYAEAICNLADNYNKKLGVEIAIGRALKWLERNPKTSIRSSVYSFDIDDNNHLMKFEATDLMEYINSAKTSKDVFHSVGEEVHVF